MKYLFLVSLVSCLIFSCSRSENKLPLKKTSKTALTIMRANDCFGCHSIQDPTGVPSYQMIAARYETNQQVISELSSKVMEGGGGKWGSGQMVKHPFLKAKDVRNIIKWVLSLDSDSVLTALKPPNAKIFEDTTHRFLIEIYEKDKKIFIGSMDEINLASNELIEKNNRVFIRGTISITERGKYFFYLRKSGQGKMSKSGNMVISDRADDNEIMLELDPESYPFQIEYEVNSDSDTLSLFWIPVGKDYYEVMR